ncbi:MAG: Flp family type IVb pilin [Deltaproteobacteria bacterium]|nr:MAG: Flp family type IVb pilin [Deltaproteobacteria bacterium]
MNYFNSKFKTKWPVKYLGGEEGVVIIEYVLISALIAVALIGLFIALREKLGEVLNYIIGKLQDAQSNT